MAQTITNMIWVLSNDMELKSKEKEQIIKWLEDYKELKKAKGHKITLSRDDRTINEVLATFTPAQRSVMNYIIQDEIRRVSYGK